MSGTVLSVHMDHVKVKMHQNPYGWGFACPEFTGEITGLPHTSSCFLAKKAAKQQGVLHPVGPMVCVGNSNCARLRGHLSSR